MIRVGAKIAKITRPSAAGMLLRKKLFHLLDKRRDFPIVQVTGPPGSGKTKLVASYIETRKFPCIWYQIDEGDTDIATFFYYMGIAAKRAASTKRKPLPLFTTEYRKGMPAFTRRYFEDLYSRFQAPFIFVFDNYQDLPISSGFHEMLSYGLDIIPEGIQVVLISRRELHQQFSRLRANGKIYVLGWHEIQFTFEETRKLAQEKGHRNLIEEILIQLHKKTAGWVAGIVLMLDRLKTEGIDSQLINRVPPREIFDYFANEIFKKVDRQTKEILLQTSFLPRLTSPMAEKLTGIIISRQILSDISKNYYFIDIFPQDEPVYQYHPLFKEFLLSRAKDSFSPSKISQIMQHTAVLLEESGQLEDAAKIFCKTHNFEGLTRIIRNHFQSMVEQGRSQTLIEWLNFIPREIFVNNPWLLYQRGICLLTTSPTESLAYFEEAFHKFKAQQDASGLFFAWSGIVESIMYGSGGLKPLDHWFSIISELLKEFNGFPSEYIEANVVCSMIRALALRRPTHINMDEWVDRVSNIILRSTDVPLKIRALTNLSYYWYTGGELQKLRIIVDSLNKLLTHSGVSPLTQLIFYWVQAAYFNMSSLYNDCQKIVSDGLQLAHATEIHIMDYMLMAHGAMSSLKKGDFYTAKKFLLKMASTLSTAKPWEARFFYYISAWEALYHGDIWYAFQNSEECLKLCEDIGNPWNLYLAHLQRAFLFHELGENEKADDHLEKARQIGIQSKNKFAHFSCSLTKAYFSLNRQEEESALKTIQDGMRIGQEKGFLNIYMCPPGSMEKVVSKALESGIEVTYVQDLIKRNAFLPDPSHVEIEYWPWPLKIFTLGRFGLIKDGKPLKFSGKVQHKPLALLKALVAFGGREVAEGRLIDIFWPEADGDAAHSAFTTTLSRLRQFLGIEQVIKLSEGKVLLDSRYCYVDIWAFERILGKVDAGWEEGLKKGNIAHIIQLAEKAMRVYKGPFLSGDDEPWMIPTREHLRNKFLRNVKRVGYYWEHVGELDKASECYQKGLDVDDLVEEFYQCLIRCYKLMGRQGEALAVYNRCCKVLSAVLGIKPSPETEAIYKTH